MKHALAILFLFGLVNCKSTQTEDSLSEIEKQNARDELCGVELYKEREDRICGEIYVRKPTSVCGVGLWKSCKSKRCKDSVEYDEYRVNHQDKKGLGCKDGYDLRNVEAVYQTITAKGGPEKGESSRVRVGYSGMCVQDEDLKSCRKDFCGVEAYKKCRHRSHGLEGYGKCRRANFGVEKYKECEFYKNPEQALVFAERIRSDMPMMATHLFIHKGNYYAHTRNYLALVCHIKRYDGDPLYPEVIQDLKLKFQAIYGKPYSPNLEECEGKTEDISKIECEADDNSPRCQSAFGYRAAWTWFTENILDLGLIIQDLTDHNVIQANQDLQKEVTQTAGRPFSVSWEVLPMFLYALKLNNSISPIFWT